MLQKSAKFNIQNASERVTHPFDVLGAVVVDRRAQPHTDWVFIPSHAQGNCIILMYYHHWRHLTYTTVTLNIRFFFLSFFVWVLLLFVAGDTQYPMGWCLMTHKRLHTHKPYELASWSQIKYSNIPWKSNANARTERASYRCCHAKCTTPDLL